MFGNSKRFLRILSVAAIVSLATFFIIPPVIEELYVVSATISFQTDNNDTFQAFWYRDHTHFEELKSYKKNIDEGAGQATFIVPLKYLDAFRLDFGDGSNNSIIISRLEIGDMFYRKYFSTEEIFQNFLFANSYVSEISEQGLRVEILNIDPYFFIDSLGLDYAGFEKGLLLARILLSLVAGAFFYLAAVRFSLQKVKLAVRSVFVGSSDIISFKKLPRALAKRSVKDARDFCVFLRVNKIYILISAFFAILAYGYCISSYALTVDNEMVITSGNTYKGVIKSWLNQGRFGVASLKLLFGDFFVIPFWNKLVSVVILYASALVFAFQFQKEAGSVNDRSIVVLGFLSFFSTIPISMYYLIYDIFNIEISCGFLLVAICTFCAAKYVIHGQNAIYFLLSALILGFTIGIYQSFAFLYVGSVLIIMMLALMPGKAETAEPFAMFFYAVRFIAIFISGFIAFFACTKILEIVFGFKDSYSSLYMSWGGGFMINLYSIVKSIAEILPAPAMTYLAPSLFITTAILVLLAALKKIGWSMIFLFLCLSLNTVFLRIVIGTGAPIRTDQALMLAMGGSWFVALSALNKTGCNKFGHTALAVLMFFSFSQSQITARLTAGTYAMYQNDILLASQISARVYDSVNGTPNGPVAFIGNPKIVRNNTLVIDSLDELGKSSFEWIYPYMNARKNMFFQTLGIDFKMPSAAEFDAAQEFAQSMPAWPAEGCVAQLDNVVVVKLG